MNNNIMSDWANSFRNRLQGQPTQSSSSFQMPQMPQPQMPQQPQIQAPQVFPGVMRQMRPMQPPTGMRPITPMQFPQPQFNSSPSMVQPQSQPQPQSLMARIRDILASRLQPQQPGANTSSINQSIMNLLRR